MKKLFFCLGVTKGGTTWLHWCLSHHPAIAEIPRKEIHYFLRQYGGVDRLTDLGRMHQLLLLARRTRLSGLQTQDLGRVEWTDPDVTGSPWDDAMAKAWGAGGRSLEKYEDFCRTLDWYKEFLRGPVNDDWYRGLFQNCPDGGWPIDFSTTNYLASDAGFQAMAQFAEDTRAILILRDPVDRLWSHLKFHAEVTGDLDNLEHWSAQDIRDFAVRNRLALGSFYAEPVARMMRHFPQDKRLIVDFGDLRRRPEDLFAEILDFLGLEQIPMPVRNKEDVRLNASKDLPLPRGAFSAQAKDFHDDLVKLEAMGLDFVKPWITNATSHANETPDTSTAPRRGWRRRLFGSSP